jgi:hypothetical protein
MPAMKTHDQRCSEEATRDVIFVFQVRNRQIIREPEGYEYDGEGWVRVIEDGEDDDQGYTSVDELAAIDDECFIDLWRVESVWLDRDEAEAWGESHAYRFENPRKGEGWRVYGVPSYGSLATLLQSQNKQATL